MSVIQFDRVTKAFRGRTLYKNVTFSVEDGSLTSLVGANGAGKSVLFRLMCGFLKPDAGRVRIDPTFLSRRRTFPEHFGVLIDRPGYLPGRTGLRNLQELAAIRGQISESEIHQSMALVGLDPSLKQRVRHYSLGMKQKLALAQAFMENPRVLILDEPFNGLDAASTLNIRSILKSLNQEGVTIVFTSHNADDITDLSTARLEIADEKVLSI